MGELDLRVICIDGKVFRDHCMVMALGIDTQGCKHVLGLRERSHRDCDRRQRPAQRPGETRGLPTDRTLLFVIDGAPGLRRAITECLRFPRGGATLPSTQAPQRARPSARTAARFGRQGVAGMPGTSSQRTLAVPACGETGAVCTEDGRTFTTGLATQIRGPASGNNNWSDESVETAVTPVPALPLAGIGILGLLLELLGSRRGRNDRRQLDASRGR